MPLVVSVTGAHRQRWRQPFLYSEADIAAVMAATETLGGPLRAATYRTMFALSAVTACSGGKTEDFSGPSATLRVFGDAGLADMTPILREAAEATGVTVELTPTGSITGARTVLEGRADGSYDAIWLSSEDHLRLHPQAAAKFDGTAEIMSSPVILGVRAVSMKRLGWDAGSVSWAELAAQAAQGRFTFGMTDPAESYEGLAALTAAATALADGGALQPGGQDRAAPRLTGLFRAQSLKGATTSWLLRTYRDSLRNGSASVVDAIVGHESEILAFNASHSPEERLVPVAPTEGAITTDHPLSLLATASALAKDAYQRLTGYLRTASTQRRIMRLTHRRPIIGEVPLSPELAARQPFQTLLPAQPATVDGLLDAYNERLRRPGRTVYLLDTSGSMKGARLKKLQEALTGLTAADTAAPHTAFHRSEQVTFLPFSTTPPHRRRSTSPRPPDSTWPRSAPTSDGSPPTATPPSTTPWPPPTTWSPTSRPPTPAESSRSSCSPTERTPKAARCPPTPLPCSSSSSVMPGRRRWTNSSPSPAARSSTPRSAPGPDLPGDPRLPVAVKPSKARAPAATRSLPASLT